MRKKSISIFDEPFEKVAFLYAKKVAIEKANNIPARTRLLKLHPDLFNKDVFSEIEFVIKSAQKVTKTMNNNNKVIHFDFKERIKTKMLNS